MVRWVSVWGAEGKDGTREEGGREEDVSIFYEDVSIFYEDEFSYSGCIYVYLHACLSLRVTEGHSLPIHTVTLSAAKTLHSVAAHS